MLIRQDFIICFASHEIQKGVFFNIMLCLRLASDAAKAAVPIEPEINPSSVNPILPESGL